MLERQSPVAFLVGTAAVLAICFAVVLLSFRMQYGLHTIESAGRCRSVQEKIDLARDLKTPKIVFIGGSSVHWGINAEEVGRAVSRDGLNFGTFAALGPEMILWQARRVLNEGDVAILAFEYSMYSERSLSSDAISYALGCDRSFLAAMAPRELVATALASDPARPFKAVQWLLSHRDGSDTDDAASPLARSQHGDPASSSFHKMASEEIRERVRLYQPLSIRVNEDSTVIKALDEFKIWAAAHNVTIYATWPNTIAFEAYDGDPGFSKIRELYEEKGIKMLGEPEMAMYPAALFYDTQYHLSEAGIERRTNDLLAVLKDQIAPTSAMPKSAMRSTPPSSRSIVR